MQSTDHAFVLDAIRNHKQTRNQPGLPLSQLPSACGGALQKLIDDGSVTLLNVTKPDKVNRSRTVTYRYLRLGDA